MAKWREFKKKNFHVHSFARRRWGSFDKKGKTKAFERNSQTLLKSADCKIEQVSRERNLWFDNSFLVKSVFCVWQDKISLFLWLPLVSLPESRASTEKGTTIGKKASKCHKELLTLWVSRCFPDVLIPSFIAHSFANVFGESRVSSAVVAAIYCLCAKNGDNYGRIWMTSILQSVLTQN